MRAALASKQPHTRECQNVIGLWILGSSGVQRTLFTECVSTLLTGSGRAKQALALNVANQVVVNIAAYL